jgi:hypothetical protein
LFRFTGQIGDVFSAEGEKVLVRRGASAAQYLRHIALQTTAAATLPLTNPVPDDGCQKVVETRYSCKLTYRLHLLCLKELFFEFLCSEIS